MADQFVRLEGDYAIYSADGVEYRRWAVGNSQGKRPNTFADRHPKTKEAIRAAFAKRGVKTDLSDVSIGRALSLVKGQYQASRVLAAQREAELGLLRAALKSRPGSAALPAEAWGVVVERQGDIALDGDAEDSTRAARFVGQTLGYLGGEGGPGPAQAVQVNVTIGGELADRYSEVIEVRPIEGGPELAPTLPSDGEEE